jgi:multidrug resistance efflux pump
VRDRLIAYTQISGCKTLLLLPLQSRTGPIGILVMESWADEPIHEFEAAAAGVYAQHVAIALDNKQFFGRLPLSARYARKRDRELARLKGRTPWTRRIKYVLILIALAGLVGWFGFVEVDETVSSECQVEPSDWAIVVPKIPGEIEKVHVSLGSEVGRDDVMFEFDTDLLELQQGKLKYEIEQIQRTRQRLLAEAAVLADAGQEGGAKIAEFRAKEAEEAAKRQELMIIEVSLKDSRVRAPISGVVTEPSEPEELTGRVVGRGDPLCRIANLKTVRINVAVEEPYLHLVKPGQEVEISLEARLTEKYLTARIKHLHLRSTVFKNQNVSFAEVFVPNDDGFLKPGMTGKALVKVGRSTSVTKWWRRGKRKALYWWF